MVNIQLRVFKYFIATYSTICTFVQTVHFQYSCNFHLKTFQNQFLQINLNNSICFSYAFRTNSSNLETRIGEDRTNQNRRFDSDLRNLDFNTGFPPRQPLFKYNDNHILVGYSRSFWSGFMSTRYPFNCKIF